MFQNRKVSRSLPTPCQAHFTFPVETGSSVPRRLSDGAPKRGCGGVGGGALIFSSDPLLLLSDALGEMFDEK